jgi:phytanoyl-CoA hydroxylase
LFPQNGEIMISELTGTQIESYHEHGFLVVEEFLNDDELEMWRQCVEDAVTDRLGGSVEHLTNQANPQDFYARVFTQCLRLADTNDALRELVYDPRLGKLTNDLVGTEGIRVWHDQALIKPPHGNPTAWHLDVPYWSFDSHDAISFWLALDNATLENGCMWYIPRSHKTARFDNVGIGHNVGELFNVYPEWRDIDPVPVPCPAGSIVWHNGLCAHGAGANMTNKYRRAMTCAFMPDGSCFNGKRNILPQDLFESLEIGDLLANEEQNPLVWHNSWQ